MEPRQVSASSVFQSFGSRKMAACQLRSIPDGTEQDFRKFLAAFDQIACLGQDDQVTLFPLEIHDSVLPGIGRWQVHGAGLEQVALLDLIAFRICVPGVSRGHRSSRDTASSGHSGSASGIGLPRPRKFRRTLIVPAGRGGGVSRQASQSRISGPSPVAVRSLMVVTEETSCRFPISAWQEAPVSRPWRCERGLGGPTRVFGDALVQRCT